MELAQTYAKVGDLAQAEKLARVALETSEVVEDRVTRAEAWAIGAWVAFGCGQPRRCREAVDHVDEILRPLEDPADRGFVLQYVARCALSVGARADAAALVARLGREVREGALGDLRPVQAVLEGHTAVLDGRDLVARERLSDAVTLAEAAQMKPLAIEAHGALGRLLAGTDPGCEHLTRAMELMREITRAIGTEMALTYVGSVEARQVRAAFEAELLRRSLVDPTDLPGGI